MVTESVPPASPRRAKAAGPSIHGRLRLGFAAVAAAFVVLAVAAVASLDRLGDAVSTILRENYASAVLCEQMTLALERQDSAALIATLGRRDIAAPILAANRRIFEDALSKEERNVTVPGEGDLVHEIRERFTAYGHEVDRALVLPPAEQQDLYFRELLPRFTAIQERVQRVLRLNQASMEAADRNAKALARRTVDAALGVSIAAVIFVLWFAYRLPQSIGRPLAALTQSARAIGEGDLDVSVEEPDLEELSALAVAFNRMTEQLRAYRQSSLGELLAAKDLARSTLACLLDPVVVLDRDGGVLLANEAAERAFHVRGGSAEELRDAAITLPLELAEARDRALQSGAPVLPQSLSEAVPHRENGVEKHYLVRALPLVTAPKERPSAVVVAQDVTRFRRIDDLKSDMVATVSHQFKTPLTSLRMATHLLLEPSTGALSGDQRELVTTARDDTERLRTMVEELLDVVRIEAEAGALHRVSIDPSGLLYEVADAHRSIARDKGVALDVEPDGQQGSASVDPERLSIALSNLVSNAIRHTPAGGRVTLRSSREDHALRIDVADTGEGISAELLPRVFDRSFTTSSGSGQGRHGLGLSIAREIVLQHGGDLSVASEPGKGSTFSLVLPLEEGVGR
ncbi:two-component sensor histidine kinase [Minicystis rosea]|nr:two-component sensor histidine kinase [Minicystis rosea]